MLWLTLHFPALSLELFTAQTRAGQSGVNTDTDTNTSTRTHNQSGNAPVLLILKDNRVYLRNHAAQRCGIEVGSTLATAHSICPDLRYMQHDPIVESRRLAALAEALYRFSGYVSIQEPDCVVLEIGGSLKLFNDHEQLSQAAVELCKTLGHQVCARVSATPAAGIAMARAGKHKLADVPLSLAGLELAGVPDSTIERFANMGIYTLGPLLDLPATQLGQRFGKPLLIYLAKLTGDMPDPRPAITPTATFAQQLHLLDPLRHKPELHEGDYSPMRKLALELQQWLISHQLGCEQLVWKFTSCNGEAAYLPVRFARGRQNQQDFIRVSELKLEQVELPADILSISLEARRLATWQNQNQGLFQGSGQFDDPATDQDLSDLVDELRARLGDLACHGIHSKTEHTPESAWQGVIHNRTFSKTGRRKVRAGQAAEQQALEIPNRTQKRPLWLFDPPRHIRLAELDLLHGPERIQGQWWEQTSQSPASPLSRLSPQGHNTHASSQREYSRHESTWRDYYIARHRFGIECWVFVDLQGHWYLHGYFG